MIRSRLQAGSTAEDVGYATRRNKSLLTIGSYLFLGITASLLLPLTIRNTQQFTIVYVVLSFAFTLLSLLSTRVFPRQAFPALILMGMQVWTVITFLIIQPAVMTEQSLGRHLYWPILLCLPYFVLSSICTLDSSYRQKALKVLFWMCFVSAAIGIGQFLRLPGFQTIQNFYSPKTQGVDWFGDTPHAFRAVGLTLHPYLLAAQSIFGIALIGSNLLERKLKTHEVFSLAVFMGALFMAQSRTFYASGALLCLVLLVLLFRRDKPMFVWAVSLFAVFGFIVVGVFSSRLEYGVAGPSIMESGRIAKWQAAAQVIRDNPVTGIGPNMDIYGNKGLVTLSGRRGLEYTENGYRMIAATAGIPGLVILIAGLVGSLYISLRIVLKTYVEGLQRRMAFICVFYVISLAVALNISNLVEHELMTFLGMCVAAIAYPPVVYHYKGARHGLKLGHGFKNSVPN